MQKKTPEERFLEKSHKDPVTGCWLWAGLVNGAGYGKFGVDGRVWYAHRWSYMMFVGDPGDLFVCHTCDVPGCVNPEHLFLGTTTDNMRDASAKGRLATGDRHGSRLHPERWARGDQHHSRTNPERLSRGESHGNAKLTWAIVREIRARYEAGGIPQEKLASEYRVSPGLIWRIVNNLLWVESTQTEEQKKRSRRLLDRKKEVT